MAFSFKFPKLYDYNKDGKGIKKRKITDKERYSLKSFFIEYKEKFWKLITLNLIFLLMISPIMFAVVSLMGVFNIQSQIHTNVMYPILYGAHLYSPTPSLSALMGVFGTQTVFMAPSDTSRLFLLLALLVVLTFGMANAGMTYIVRAFTRGDPVFLWHDFFHAIKKNLLSSIVTGIIDLIVMAMLIYSAFYYYAYAISFTYTIMFFIVFAMAVLYFIMRFYIYLLLITFKLSPFKLIKNACILALIGIKRNIMAIIGIAVLVFINIFVFMILPGVGLVLPFLFLFSNASFISCFAAYPNIKKYMIDPYYEEHPQNNGLVIEEEPIFLDYT